MTDLRKRMMEDMQLHGYAERTRKSYADAVSGLAKHYQCPPDQLSEADIRKFFLHVINDRKAVRGTLKIHLCGIKFFYEKTLGRKWKFFDLAMPAKGRKLPTVLSRQEVDTILGLVRSAAIRVILTVIYVCGLRLNEAVSLTDNDIDSKRMQIRVCGKGSKDRYVHRVALTNNRILAIENDKVTFRYKETRKQKKEYQSRRKTMTLPVLRFMARFLQHMPPQGFHKVRYYGLWSPANRGLFNQVQLRLANEVKAQDTPIAGTENVDHAPQQNRQCRFCNKGFMRVIEIIPRGWQKVPARSPP